MASAAISVVITAIVVLYMGLTAIDCINPSLDGHYEPGQGYGAPPEWVCDSPYGTTQDELIGGTEDTYGMVGVLLFVLIAITLLGVIMVIMR
jgi:hypothetical protein